MRNIAAALFLVICAMTSQPVQADSQQTRLTSIVTIMNSCSVSPDSADPMHQPKLNLTCSQLGDSALAVRQAGILEHDGDLWVVTF